MIVFACIFTACTHLDEEHHREQHRGFSGSIVKYFFLHAMIFVDEKYFDDAKELVLRHTDGIYFSGIITIFKDVNAYICTSLSKRVVRCVRRTLLAWELKNDFITP